MVFVYMVIPYAVYKGLVVSVAKLNWALHTSCVLLEITYKLENWNNLNKNENIDHIFPLSLFCLCAGNCNQDWDYET